MERICGIWVDEAGRAYHAVAGPSGERTTVVESFRPFLWARPGLSLEGASCERLGGSGFYEELWRFDSVKALKEATRETRLRGQIEVLKPFEHQFLMATGRRLFGGLRFDELRRCQLDIETDCGEEGGFSDARRKEDRVLAVGLRFSWGPGTELLVLEAPTDEAERGLLKKVGKLLRERDPDVLEGHNVFNFDLAYLRQRCARLRVAMDWGRFGQSACFRKSRLRVAERWIDFMRCDLPGRAVFDTYLAVQLYDISARVLQRYGLKEVARHFGITREGGGRTYLQGDEIARTFAEDRERFLAYLEDDLRETAGVAEVLLPTYVAQCQAMPAILAEAVLRGTGVKVDWLMLERYLEKRYSLPDFSAVEPFEGGYTRSFVTGVFKKVLHFDVASLYPSLLLSMGRDPACDGLGVFIPLLARLRDYRLRYKKWAREEPDALLRREYAARQQSFKILINSFYGYLGFSGARFADGELAAEVTRRGRELLQALIGRFGDLGCTVLEADTDGIYVQSDAYWEEPETLRARVEDVLPEGIRLEFDGRFCSMVCYKAKNYALYDGERVMIRGSALRSRGVEPFLKELTEHLIRYLLGCAEERPEAMRERWRKRIERGEAPVEALARSEYLSQSPETYERNLETGGKSRRASLEVARMMDPRPKMGEKVRYFVARGNPGERAEWQKARPLEAYHPETNPYDAAAYVKKLTDWSKRYEAFLKDRRNKGEVQLDLFMG